MALIAMTLLLVYTKRRHGCRFVVQHARQWTRNEITIIVFFSLSFILSFDRKIGSHLSVAILIFFAKILLEEVVQRIGGKFVLSFMHASFNPIKMESYNNRINTVIKCPWNTPCFFPSIFTMGFHFPSLTTIYDRNLST